MSTSTFAATPRPATGISTALTLLLATASGMLAANIYYAQPLAGPIGAALGLSREATGLIVTLTQTANILRTRNCLASPRPSENAMVRGAS